VTPDEALAHPLGPVYRIHRPRPGSSVQLLQRPSPTPLAARDPALEGGRSTRAGWNMADAPRKYYLINDNQLQAARNIWPQFRIGRGLWC